MRGRGFLRVFIRYDEFGFTDCNRLEEGSICKAPETASIHTERGESELKNYIPISSITSVQEITSLYKLHDSCDSAHHDILSTLFDLDVCVNLTYHDPTHKCDWLDENSQHRCTLKDYLPFYVVTIKGEGDYMVHPSERERMERILGGTDDPMYDLVHELRYNPNVGLGTDLKDAKNDFNKRAHNV